MTKILVVDDEADLEALVKQKFRQKIRDKEYEFVFASNGQHALEQIALYPDMDVALVDINMPVMDGLTLLSRINEMNTLLKAVIVSAYGDMDNIRTAMNLGAFDFVTKPVNFNDLELTIEKTKKQIELMRETIAALKENNILRMYVDQTVLNFMGSREFETSLMHNEVVEASVAFIDICGFTSISEREPPDSVVGLLNTYFDIMAKAIIAQNGHVDKFIGDAIMAVFRGPYHLDRAIDACLDIRRRLAAELPKAGFTPSVSIGINCGEMISGNIGSSSLRRLDYTVIGDAVNVAQRLQASSTPNQIVIAEHAYEQVKESFQCNRIGEIQLRNKALPVVIYEVIE
jgi:adenylate cyclase